MIPITLYDSYETELSLNDVILIHYINPRVKTLGVLKFMQTQFVIATAKGWEGLHYSAHEKLEKICSLNDHPQLAEKLGRYQNKPNVKNLLEMLEKL
jgi:hypothetical protein